MVMRRLVLVLLFALTPFGVSAQQAVYDQNGAIVNLVVGCPPLAAGWVCHDVTDSDRAAWRKANPPPAVSTTLTYYDFRTRFTQAERLAINKARTRGTSNFDPVIEDWVTQAEAAAAVGRLMEVTNPSVLAGADYLAATNDADTGKPFLTSERRDKILDLTQASP